LLMGCTIGVALWLPPSWWSIGNGPPATGVDENGKQPTIAATQTSTSPPSVVETSPDKTSKKSAAAVSPYKNTRPGVKYLGSQACTACHEGEHATFAHTGMGRSMAEVDLSREPPDAVFDHPLSKRRYEVRRKEGQMWHR